MPGFVSSFLPFTLHQQSTRMHPSLVMYSRDGRHKDDTSALVLLHITTNRRRSEATFGDHKYCRRL